VPVWVVSLAFGRENLCATAASGQRPQTILSRHQEHGPDVPFRQTPPYRFLLAPSSRSKLFRSSWQLLAACRTRPTLDIRSVDGLLFLGCPSIAFSSSLSPLSSSPFCAAVCYSLAKPSRDHNTQSIHVAHTRPSTESSLTSQ
jgi:hypothetical protein